MLYSRLFLPRGVAALGVALSLFLAGCGGEAPAPQAAAPLFKNPVALQLYSLRESFKAEGVPATLAKVKAMGFTHVEVADFGGLSREEFKAELDKAGLTPIAMHVNFASLLEDPAPYIDNAKFLGMEYLGSAWYPHDPPFDAAEADRAVEEFNRVGRILKDAGLTFFYHAHGFEFTPAENGGTLFDSMVERTDPDTVKYQLDIFWAYHGGAHPAALIRRYPTRFISTHLKDMKVGTERNYTGRAAPNSSVALGTGEVDLKSVLEASRGTSIEWHIIEEESSTPEVLIPEGLAYLRSLEAGQ